MRGRTKLTRRSNRVQTHIILIYSCINIVLVRIDIVTRETIGSAAGIGTRQTAKRVEWRSDAEHAHADPDN
jgi:hypothetical protein